MPSGYIARTPTDILLDTAVLKADLTTPGTMEVIGVSRGGLTFDPGKEMREVDYDGRKAPVAGLDRQVFSRPKISGSVLQLAEQDVLLLEPGSTNSAAGTPVVNTITPKAIGAMLAISDYHKFELTYDRAGGGTVKYTFPYGLVVKYGPVSSSDKNEGEIPIEIEARQRRDDASSTDGEVLYTITVTDPA